MPIRVLDATTISKIAAGEVVERPASVLKELVENAIDAGARHITVEIRAGGIDYMRITDDGCGIPPEQVRLAFENHATSKLKEVKDLVEVSTMGFRGEALPSIAAVSKVELTTRQHGADNGTKIALEGGSVLDVAPAGCPDGTTVQVKELFFNLPARRAFLKKPGSEAGACIDTMMRLALGNVNVAFRMTSNGKLAFRTHGDGVLRHAVMAAYDRQTAENMRDVDGTIGSLHISGLVGVGSCAKASRSHQHFFVNGRAIRCPVLSQALEAACRGRVLIGRFPMCALNITLPQNSVDVNVHPGKLEVRFRDEAGLFTAASVLLEQAFSDENMYTAEKPEQAAAKPDIFVIGGMQPGETQKNAETGANTADNAGKPAQGGAATAAAAGENKPAAPAVESSATMLSADKDTLGIGVIKISSAPPAGVNAGKTPERPRTAATVGQPGGLQTAMPQKGGIRLNEQTQPAAPGMPAPGFGNGIPPRGGMAGKVNMPHVNVFNPLDNIRMPEPAAKRPADVSTQKPQPESPQVAQQPEKVPEPAAAQQNAAPVPGSLMEAAGMAVPDALSGESRQVVGTAFATYIFVQSGDTLYVIDQHAAHERLLYEKFMRQWENGVASQMLLVPYTLSVSAAEKAQIMENKELLREIGFEIEDFGERDIQVRAVPQIMGEPDLRPFFLMSAAELKRLKSAPLAARRDAVMQAACKHAVKGGDTLSRDDINSLLEQMRVTGAPPNCPHGRPIIIAMPRSELEKRFSRIV